MVVYPRNLSQFLPPVRCVMHSGSPGSTQLSKSSTGGSGEDLFLSSSSDLPPGSCRKWLTSGPNSGRASRSKSRRTSSSSSNSGTPQGSAVFKERGRGSPLATPSSNLLFCPWILCLWQSQLLEWVWASHWLQVMDWLSCYISSSKVATVARASQWASLTLARPLSAEVSLPPSWGFAPQRARCQLDQFPPSSIMVHPPSAPGQSFSEDTISAASSSIHSSSHGEDPGSLLGLYTS